MCAFTTFLLVLILILEHYNFAETPGANPFPFGSFGLHPILMVSAFGLCSPVAVVSYKTYEHFLGASHGAVKALHAFLQSAALVLGGLGIASMYDTHSGARHFQTAHSWIGLAGFAIFAIQWFVGMVCFMAPCTPAKIRACLLVPHVMAGIAASLLTILAVASGPLALVWKPQNSTEFPNDAGFVSVGVWELANAASLASAGLLLFLVLTMVEAQRIKMGSKKR